MADQQVVSPNAAQIEFWNSAAARAWADQYERMDRAVADLTKALLDMAAPQLGEHVLDIGCGSGTTVLELAARVGPGGHVLGADISNQSVTRARQRIADTGHVLQRSAGRLSKCAARDQTGWASGTGCVPCGQRESVPKRSTRSGAPSPASDPDTQGRRSQGLSPGPMQPAFIESWKAPASARFP